MRPSLFTSPRSRRPRWRRVLRWSVIAVAGLVALIVLGGAGLWWYANSQMQRISPEALDVGSGTPDAVPGTLNVLVVGSDSREGLSEEQLLALGTEAVGGDRTDTIMLVQVSPARERAVILSFPRDLLVRIPGDGRAKINSVYGRGETDRGGADLLIRTVQDYTGVNIDHYVEVRLAGFLRLAEVLGGVEVCLDQPLKDRYAGVDLPAGCQQIGAVEAAGFVRARHATTEQWGVGDFGRISRQQYFIKQAMREVLSAGTLLNPLRLKRLVDLVAANVVTDDALGVGQMLRLARALRGLRPEEVETRMVPSYAEGGSVHAHPERAESLFQALREGRPLPQVGLTPPTRLTPEDVSVHVLNGAGREGLAAEVAEFLSARGFTVAEVGNAESFDRETTEVSHGPGGRDHAELVASFFPGAEVTSAPEAPEGADVVVVVGDDWERS